MNVSSRSVQREQLTRPFWAIAALLGAALLLIGVTLYVESMRQNELEREHEERAVQARLSMIGRVLANSIADYTEWSDAVEHMVLTYDPAWATQNIGPFLNKTYDYTSLVLGGDGALLYGQLDGTEGAEAAAAALGPALQQLADHARQTDERLTTILNGPEGLFMAAAAAIRSDTDAPIVLPPGPRAVMVFATHLGPELLRQIERDFGLHHLGITDHDPGTGARVSLVGPSGEAVAYVAWQQRRPGQEQLVWFAPSLLGMMLTIGSFAALALRAMRLAAAAHESESRFRSLVENLRGIVFCRGRAGDGPHGYDPAGVQLFGADVDRFVGAAVEHPQGRLAIWHNAIAPDDQAAYLIAEARRKTWGEPYDLEYRITSPVTGEKQWMREGGWVVDAGDGRRYLDGYIIDVTEQKEVEAQLRVAGEQVELALRAGRMGTWAWEIDADRIVWDEAECKLYGLKPDEAPKTISAFLTLVHPEDRPMLEDAALPGIAGTPFEHEFRIRHADGTIRWIAERGNYVLDREGQSVRAIGINFDVTEEKQSSEALEEARLQLERQAKGMEALAVAAEQASRAKSEFLAAMSHEIRTPMTAVLGMADLLAAEELTERQHDYVDAVRSSGRHLLSIINDILDFSQIEAGRLKLEQVDFSLAEILEQVSSLMTPQAIERGLALTLKIDEHSLPVVQGDPTRLRQVLLNLVGNALKFTRQGSVNVRARCLEVGEEGVRIQVEVQDTGIGITAEQQAGLFRAFTQAEQSTARHFGGSGLGLAISKWLIEAMGGTIGVESEPGRGSIFRFEVPLALGSVVTVQEEAAAKPIATSPLRVLIAEDVALNRDLLRAMLTKHGHTVTLAENGQEALGRAGEAMFDVILMDVQMPVMDGIEATRRIRRLPPPAGAMPIIALTANVMAAEKDRCLAVGMNHVLTKPVTWPALFAAMAEAAREGVKTAPVPTAPAVVVSEQLVLDLAMISGLSKSMEPAMLAEFLDEMVEEAQRAHAAMLANAGDPAELRRLAHRLCGTAGTFGFARIAALAGSLDDAAATPEDVTDLVNRLGEAVPATREAVAGLTVTTLP